MIGPSAVRVLAKIDLGGVHSQRSVTGASLQRGILDYGLPRGVSWALL
jgi:hypothetical protein